jgi:hypothetical protein
VSFTLETFNESGPVVSGRGTVAATLDFNMKSSGDPAVLYYPHDAAANAPLIRPIAAGELVFSYKVYTFFKLSGTYNKIKNLKLKLQLGEAAQATKAMLFYKLTSTYAEPDNAFDGYMNCAYNGSVWSTGETELVLRPMWSTTSPITATTRNIVYGPNETLYSQYLVTQLYVAPSAATGNSAEFKARLEFDEIGEL